MHGRLIAAVILGVTLLCMRVPSVRADALGLDEGTYNLTVVFPGGSGTGTMTIGLDSVTDFHLDSTTLGHFDCDNGCIQDSQSPDRVASNLSFLFQIFDNAFDGPVAPTNTALALLTGGDAFIIVGDLGTWSVTRVPEPASLSLLGFGAVALYLRRRRKS